jgi:hypothetical protein
VVQGGASRGGHPALAPGDDPDRLGVQQEGGHRP